MAKGKTRKLNPNKRNGQVLGNVYMANKSQFIEGENTKYSDKYGNKKPIPYTSQINLLYNKKLAPKGECFVVVKVFSETSKQKKTYENYCRVTTHEAENHLKEIENQIVKSIRDTYKI